MKLFTDGGVPRTGGGGARGHLRGVCGLPADGGGLLRQDARGGVHNAADRVDAGIAEEDGVGMCVAYEWIW